MARIQVPLPAEAASATWSCFRARGHPSPSPSLCLSPVFGAGRVGGPGRGLSGRIFLFLHTGDSPNHYPRRDGLGGSVQGNQFFPFSGQTLCGLLPLAARARSRAGPLFHHLHADPSIASVPCPPAPQLPTGPLRCPGPTPSSAVRTWRQVHVGGRHFSVHDPPKDFPWLRGEFRTTPNVNSPDFPSPTWLSHLASLGCPGHQTSSRPRPFALAISSARNAHGAASFTSPRRVPKRHLLRGFPCSCPHLNTTPAPRNSVRPTAKLPAPFMHLRPPLRIIQSEVHVFTVAHLPQTSMKANSEREGCVTYCIPRCPAALNKHSVREGGSESQDEGRW